MTKTVEQAEKCSLDNQATTLKLEDTKLYTVPRFMKFGCQSSSPPIE